MTTIAVDGDACRRMLRAVGQSVEGDDAALFHRLIARAVGAPLAADRAPLDVTPPPPPTHVSLPAAAHAAAADGPHRRHAPFKKSRDGEQRMNPAFYFYDMCGGDLQVANATPQLVPSKEGNMRPSVIRLVKNSKSQTLFPRWVDAAPKKRRRRADDAA